MTNFPFTPAQAKKLHQSGQAQKMHGSLDTGLLKASVYGANDGIITTFAVVAGVAGAGLSPTIIIILGVANMIADAISMGLGDYLGERSERRHQKYQYQVEKWEIEHIPDEEKKELVLYFQAKGVKDVDTEKLVDLITKYPKLWTELGFIDEMGVTPDFSGGVWKTGLITFISFVLAGSLPLLPYLVEVIGVPIPMDQQFSISVIATLLTLFFVGSLRTLITKGAWWKNGSEMLLIGSVAAAAAYVLGAVVEQMVR
jgi:vacuolar iron transporter family protein